MIKLITTLALTGLLFSGAAQARDKILTLPLDGIIGTEKANQALLNVPIYFADQSYPETSTHRSEVTTSRRTNAVGKSDTEACQWVLLSAIKVLQDAAKKQGFDAVVNIRSNYKHNEFSSSTEFQCGAGAIMAGVALKGELVKFE